MSRKQVRPVVEESAAVMGAAQVPAVIFYKAGGLVEREAAPGSPHRVLETVDGSAPTPEQRVAMAKRIQEHQGQGAYVQRRLKAVTQQAIQPQESSEMTKKGQQPEAAAPAQPAQGTVTQSAREFLAERGVEPSAAKKKRTVSKAAKRAKPAAPSPEKSVAQRQEERSKGGRPAKAVDANQKYRVLKDNTRSGHMKVFMAKAAELKTFTREQLVAATKAKVTVERAERYFDYCLYKGLLGEAR